MLHFPFEEFYLLGGGASDQIIAVLAMCVLDRHRHLVVKSAGYMQPMSYDPHTIATLRRAFDEVLRDSRLYGRKSASALEIAEHLLAQAAAGERDLERLKSSAFKKLAGNTERVPNQAA